METTLMLMPPSPCVVACCVCSLVRIAPEVFVSAPEVLVEAGDDVSHTYCPECAERLFGITRDAYRCCKISPADAPDPATL